MRKLGWVLSTIAIMGAWPTLSTAQTGATFIRNQTQATICGTEGVPCAAAVDNTGQLLTAFTVAEDAAVSAGQFTAIVGGMRDDDVAVDAGADTDASIVKLDNVGRLLVNPWGNATANFVRGADAADRTTAATTSYVAAAVGRFNFISAWGCVNTAAVASRVQLLCASTPVAYGFLVATSGQFTTTFPTPIRCGANEAVQIAIDTASTATRCFVNGVQAVG